jgi:hypothetical protein
MALIATSCSLDDYESINISLDSAIRCRSPYRWFYPNTHLTVRDDFTTKGTDDG